MAARKLAAVPDKRRAPVERVACDDCTLDIAGEEFRPHEGEWVEILPVLKVSDLQLFERIMDFGDKLAIARGESAREVTSLLASEFTHFCDLLARRIVAWNWTDVVTGEPLPQPFGRPEVLAELTEAELVYLTLVLRGHRAVDRKNA